MSKTKMMERVRSMLELIGAPLPDDPRYRALALMREQAVRDAFKRERAFERRKTQTQADDRFFRSIVAALGEEYGGNCADDTRRIVSEVVDLRAQRDALRAELVETKRDSHARLVEIARERDAARAELASSREECARKADKIGEVELHLDAAVTAGVRKDKDANRLLAELASARAEVERLKAEDASRDALVRAALTVDDAVSNLERGPYSYERNLQTAARAYRATHSTAGADDLAITQALERGDTAFVQRAIDDPTTPITPEQRELYRKLITPSFRLVEPTAGGEVELVAGVRLRYVYDDGKVAWGSMTDKGKDPEWVSVEWDDGDITAESVARSRLYAADARAHAAEDPRAKAAFTPVLPSSLKRGQRVAFTADGRHIGRVTKVRANEARVDAPEDNLYEWRLCDADAAKWQIRILPDVAPAEGRWEVEALAEFIRVAWVCWARTQPNPKTSWLVSWATLDEQSRDADRAIARAIIERWPPPAKVTRAEYERIARTSWEAVASGGPRSAIVALVARELGRDVEE
jgi:hypothetical protein